MFGDRTRSLWKPVWTGFAQSVRTVSPRQWIVVSTLLLALISFANPYRHLAMATANRAKPKPPPPAAAVPESGWCIAFDFEDWDNRKNPMNDRGLAGDEVSEDGSHSFEYRFEKPGRFYWLAVSCGDWSIQLPEKAAWVNVREADQRVLFKLSLRDNGEAPAYYALVAEDGHAEYTAVGEFQGWHTRERVTALTNIGDDWFELAARAKRPGSTEVRIVATGSWLVHGTAGRSSNGETGFELTARQEHEWLVFRLHRRTGEAYVLHGFSPLLAWLAYATGNIAIGVALLAICLGALLTPVRDWLLLRHAPTRDAGCPRCGSARLERVSRRPIERKIGRLGLPIHRYECPDCGWEGPLVYRD